MKKMIALLLSLFAVQTALAELPVVTEKLDLEAAKNFAVDRLEGGYSLITVQNGGLSADSGGYGCTGWSGCGHHAAVHAA